jgi:hypothetical protein
LFTADTLWSHPISRQTGDSDHKVVRQVSKAMAIPNMSVRHPWLADSVFPIVHGNAAATDSVAHAGPTRGRQLTRTDVKTVPGLYCSSGTVKRAGDATIIIASGIDGIRKIDATGQAFDLVSFLPYPGLEALSRRATPEALVAALAETDAAVRAKSDSRTLALSGRMAELGFGREQLVNGVYNLIDRDGFHYAAFGALKIIKSTDDNDPRQPLRVARVKDLSTELSPAILKHVTIINGLSMTYDGDLAAAARGALFLLDRDLNPKGTPSSSKTAICSSGVSLPSSA